jgi:SAM-dependent methyltransferase
LVSALQRRFSKYRFYCRDVDNEPLSLGDQEFDTVMVVAVIEHLAHPERVLQEARSYLRPRGLLIITTPTPIGHVIHRVGARLGLFSLESAKDHKMMYDFDALSLLLKRSGFQVVKYEKFELGANQLFVCMKS